MDRERLAHLIREQAGQSGKRIDTRASERAAEHILRDRDRGAPPPDHVVADRRRRDNASDGE